MSTDIRHEIREYIQPKFPDVEFRDDQDIFAMGFVNSLFAMELVLFLEKKTGGSIPNDLLNFDNFRTVDAMVTLAGKLAAQAPEPAGRA
ncbi:acyl carrier protein [Streptomyces ipomoeae]|uniref:acyl carrier protein n=1 Tax=Streptomyces ipomoeae TaxID=103232 RepID=UPI0011463A2C|nr:acyl carrier protein [Streptomyces ipomoeae]MDX2939095.1 acyl carrier protein [Streptomyces ipomoeae]TQE30886.1 acyl carrier protein [Streptomyces ipomoeae]